MNALLAPLRELVSRRLWPVALLLLAAAVAAPIYLSTETEVPTASTVPSGAFETDPLTGEAFVSVRTEDGVERRRVLGARKDPFRPSGEQPKPAKPVTTASGSSGSGSGSGKPSSSASSSVASTGGGAATGGADAGGTPAPDNAGGTGIGTAPVAPAPAPKPAARTYDLYSLSVRFAGERRTLKRLDPLPDAETPAVIYLGLLEDRRTAVFLLDSNVEPDGDGSCHPSPSDCQRLYLKKGETAFFDVITGEGVAQQYQLDLIKIHTKKTASATKAKAAYAAVSSKGRRALRSRMGRVGRLRYDARTGTLRKLSPKGWRASVARAAAARAR